MEILPSPEDIKKSGREWWKVWKKGEWLFIGGIIVGAVLIFVGLPVLKELLIREISEPTPQTYIEELIINRNTPPTPTSTIDDTNLTTESIFGTPFRGVILKPEVDKLAQPKVHILSNKPSEKKDGEPYHVKIKFGLVTLAGANAPTLNAVIPPSGDINCHPPFFLGVGVIDVNPLTDKITYTYEVNCFSESPFLKCNLGVEYSTNYLFLSPS